MYPAKLQSCSLYNLRQVGELENAIINMSCIQYRLPGSKFKPSSASSLQVQA